MKHTGCRSCIFLLLAMLAAATGCGPAVETAAPADVHSSRSADTTVVLLDVRTPEEFASETGHLPGAILIPVQELEARVSELEPYRNRPVVTYCRSGHRSATAAEILQKHGFKVRSMEGGITQWRAEGLPVVQEQNR